MLLVFGRDPVHHHLSFSSSDSICQRRPVIINVIEQSLRRIALSVVFAGRLETAQPGGLPVCHPSLPDYHRAY